MTSAAAVSSGEREATEAVSKVPIAPIDAGSISVTYSHSGRLFERLAQLGLSIAFTSYQSSFLYLLGSSDGRAQLHQSVVSKPMGLWADEDGDLLLTGRVDVTRYRNVLRPGEQVNQTFDACYSPRTSHLTGELDAHDITVDREGRVVFVATRFNCLATLSDTHSFTPLWKPPFISAIVDEDRCHLNGLAMDGGKPAWVTAVSRSDTIDGWRDRRRDGGIVVDVPGDEIACTGLSMPHSPRLHRDELWLLNAGAGELGVMLPSGQFEPRVFCPGFLRGLAFHGNLAFVGLSRPRYERFEGLALEDRLAAADSEPWCGIQVIDLDRGVCVDWFRIDGNVAELYDLALIRGPRCPMAVSLQSPDAAELITIDDTSAMAVVASPISLEVTR